MIFMNEYIIPIAIFLGFGAVSGILLVIASKFLHVEADETAPAPTAAAVAIQAVRVTPMRWQAVTLPRIYVSPAVQTVLKR